MSVYDLLQALVRYRKVVIGGFFLLILAVGAMTFKLEDGKPTWRAAPKYDSSVQIAVIPPGIDSLTTASVQSGEMQSAAVLYAALLETDEAARFVGEANGYKLNEAVTANADKDAALITASVSGPSPEQARGAALSTFDYLEQKLQTPLRIADLPEPPVTTIALDGPFDSAIILTVDQSLSSTPPDLFLLVESGLDNPTTLPISLTAGESVVSRATLSPVTVLTLSLQDDEGVLDVARVAPPAPERVVSAAPVLELALRPGAIVTTGGEEPSRELDPSRIQVRWQEAPASLTVAPVPGQDVQIALLTPEPGHLNVGGRRGPIVLVSALIVGAVLILSGVIVADAWRRERERRIGVEEDQQALIVADAWLQDPDMAIAEAADAAPPAPTPARALGDGSPWAYEAASAASRANNPTQPQDTPDDDPETQKPWRQLG